MSSVVSEVSMVDCANTRMVDHPEENMFKYLYAQESTRRKWKSLNSFPSTRIGSK